MEVSNGTGQEVKYQVAGGGSGSGQRPQPVLAPKTAANNNQTTLRAHHSAQNATPTPGTVVTFFAKGQVLKAVVTPSTGKVELIEKNGVLSIVVHPLPSSKRVNQR